MTKQVQDAYIVAAVRTPVGKAPRGMFRNTRPDDMLAHVLREAIKRAPGIDVARIGDAIIGCAMPEAEQGMNVARIGVLLAGLPDSVPGMTINRFCSSGLQAVALAADRIRLGEADLMLAGGTESMSMVPMMGHKIAMNPAVFADENIGIAYGMGITAEKVAERWKVTREEQDAFALQSHQRAIAAIAAGEFNDEIAPFPLDDHYPDLADAWDRRRRAQRRHRRRPAQGHHPGSAGQAQARVPHGRQRHRRQFLADVRRRRRGAARQRTGDQGLRPDAARALRRLRRRRRAAGNHGHRTEGSDSASARSRPASRRINSTGSSSTKRSPRSRSR